MTFWGRAISDFLGSSCPLKENKKIVVVVVIGIVVVVVHVVNVKVWLKSGYQ